LWHQRTMVFCNLFWNTMCEFWIGWTMTNGHNFCLYSCKYCIMVPMCCPSIGHFSI
jgi:hypothetical protein